MKSVIAFAALSLALAGNAFADDVACVIEVDAQKPLADAREVLDVESPWSIHEYVAARQGDSQRIVISTAAALIDDAARSL